MRTLLNKFRKSKTAKAFLLILDLIIICVLVYPWIYEWQCKSRTDDELSASLTDDIMLGNIKIFDKQEEGDKFTVTYGKVRSKKYYIFDSNDGLPPVKTLKFNAYVLPGNSGSAVLNADMEIAGIVIGGGTDLLGRFKCGYMVPSDLILEFLEE